MRPHHARAALLALLLLLACAAGAASAQGPDPTAVYLPLVRGQGPDIHLTPIGAPIWRPVDLHLFAAPIGLAPDYQGFKDTMTALLPEPNHVGGGVGAPHPPPYDVELAEGVARLGFVEARQFAPDDFSLGRGVYLVWTMLPAPGVTGSSQDFSSGPVIPQVLFPIRAGSVALRDGAVYDPALYTDEIALDDPTVDGSSHFPIYVADNSDFGPPGTPVTGSYEYRVTLTDQAEQGWTIVARFTVAP